jgi:prepilin-type N-terminal cleavage/methylation domain-containing protein
MIKSQRFIPFRQLISDLNLHSFLSRRSRALAQVLPTYKRRKNRDSHKHAFTIIEVVLVLAIAGLIFLMVFIALPALQRSRHEEQKRSDMRLLVDAITRSYANTKRYPNNTSELRALAQEYLDFPGTDAVPQNGETFVDMEMGVGYRLWAQNAILNPGYLDYLATINHIYSRLMYYENNRGCPLPEDPEQSIEKPGSRIVWAPFRPRKIYCIEF